MTNLSPDTTPSVKHPAEIVPKAGIGHLAPKNGILAGLAILCPCCHRLHVQSWLLQDLRCPECCDHATDRLNAAKWREVEGE